MGWPGRPHGDGDLCKGGKPGDIWGRALSIPGRGDSRGRASAESMPGRLEEEPGGQWLGWGGGGPSAGRRN